MLLHHVGSVMEKKGAVGEGMEMSAKQEMIHRLLQHSVKSSLEAQDIDELINACEFGPTSVSQEDVLACIRRHDLSEHARTILDGIGYEACDTKIGEAAQMYATLAHHLADDEHREERLYCETVVRSCLLWIRLQGIPFDAATQRTDEILVGMLRSRNDWSTLAYYYCLFSGRLAELYAELMARDCLLDMQNDGEQIAVALGDAGHNDLLRDMIEKFGSSEVFDIMWLALYAVRAHSIKTDEDRAALCECGMRVRNASVINDIARRLLRESA